MQGCPRCSTPVPFVAKLKLINSGGGQPTFRCSACGLKLTYPLLLSAVPITAFAVALVIALFLRLSDCCDEISTTVVWVAIGGVLFLWLCVPLLFSPKAAPDKYQ